MLLEIALIVEQADGHERHAQIAGAFDVIARQHAQAARINRHRFVDAKLGREIGDRLEPQHAACASWPKCSRGQIFLQPAEGLIDAAVEHQLGRTMSSRSGVNSANSAMGL